jgi:quinol monooxygenase YgiN
MIVVAGSMRVDPAQRERFLAATRPVVAATRAEPGNVHYRYSRDDDDPSLVLIFEEWESDDALAAHFATPHMQEFLAVIPTLGITEGDVHRYEVTAKSPMS